ncbi:MAG: molybdopterin-synthase adenylyltransferase MoeB [Candidatus Schekmanbacteria bacterium]|nr:MAG: molybdopterin-synthase adenylyltransferase MoeB [Candidatus Schekmanbacteria bacterium]
MFKLTEEQIERFSRQIILPEMSGKGQQALLESKVLIVGAGGLGSPSALYLAAAGVGTIGVVDADKVDLSNLQRQILHSMKTLGVKKVESASMKLKDINPDIKVNTYDVRLTSENIMEIIKDYDVIVDGSDNFPTKFLVNDACVMSNKPLSIAGILRFMGQVFTVIPGKTPCYRCIFESPPEPGTIPSCQEAGVIGAIGGLVGIIQATEVIKIITGIGKTINGILVVDALAMILRRIDIDRKRNCAICGDSPTIKELIDYPLECEANRERND